jgi:hypothetical protein
MDRGTRLRQRSTRSDWATGTPRRLLPRAWRRRLREEVAETVGEGRTTQERLLVAVSSSLQAFAIFSFFRLILESWDSRRRRRGDSDRWCSHRVDDLATPTTSEDNSVLSTERKDPLSSYSPFIFQPECIWQRQRGSFFFSATTPAAAVRNVRPCQLPESDERRCARTPYFSCSRDTIFWIARGLIVRVIQL